MDKFKHWPGAGILARSKESNDRLDEGNDEDSETNKRVILSIGNGLELLVNDDWNHSPNTEHNC